jgi:hypothetical protein
MTPPGKRCSRCRAWKPLTAFHRDASKRDGLTYRCADCRNAARRKPWVPARCGRSRTTCPAGAGPAAPSWPPAGFEQLPPAGFEQLPPAGFEQLPPAGFEQLPPAAAGASASPATTPSRNRRRRAARATARAARLEPLGRLRASIRSYSLPRFRMPRRECVVDLVGGGTRKAGPVRPAAHEPVLIRASRPAP